MELGARAGCHTPVSACASGSEAIGYGTGMACPGGGAGVVVLESAEHAVRRGAVVHAVAAGVGYSADAYHLTQTDPDRSGPARAIGHAV